MKDMIYWLLLLAVFGYAFCTGGEETGSWEEIQMYVEKMKEVSAGLLVDEVPVTETIQEFEIEYSDGFWVEDDETIYVLATYEKYVLEYRAGETRKIPLEYSVLPADIVCIGETICIYDDSLSEVQIYSRQGELLLCSFIELQEDYVRKLVKEEGGPAVLTYNGRKIYVDTENGKQTVVEQEPVSRTDKAGYDCVEVLEENRKEVEYSIHTDIVRESTVLTGGLVLRAASPEGIFFGSYVIPTEEFDYLPGTYLHIQEDGDIYLMVTGEENLEIRKIKLGREVTSNFPAVMEKAEKLEQEYQEELEYRRVRGYQCTKRVELSREEVWERMLAMAEYEWTLRKTNTETSRVEEIVFPREIEAARLKRQEEEDWSVVMKGLPYCWGGYCSMYGGESGLTFGEALDQGYLTGNSLTEGHYKSATIGVDCSGLLTAAFDFDVKLGTKDLLELGRVLESVEQLQPMDYLVSPGSHVMVFCGWMDEATLLVCESTVREGKVILHPKTINELVVNGTYIPCTPWR